MKPNWTYAAFLMAVLFALNLIAGSGQLRAPQAMPSQAGMALT